MKVDIGVLMGKKANGEGSIYQRGDSRWAASISIGRGKRKHFLGHSRSEVAGKLAEALRDQNKGIPVISSNQTVATYLEYWLASVKTSIRPKTYESYELNVRRLKPLLGRARLTALSPAAIERAYSELITIGLAKRSVVQAHTVLHNALKKAVQWRLLGINPCDSVSVPRPERNEMQTLSQDEVMLLFTATREDALHALWVLLPTTGLRLGEALGLKWDDIDFNQDRLMVRRALQRQQGKGLAFVEPKTAKSRRTVYFPEGTSTALREHRRRQLETKLFLRPLWQENGLVFCRDDGQPLDPTKLSGKLQRVLAEAGLPKIRVHDLRHTAPLFILPAARTRRWCRSCSATARSR